MHRNSVTNTTPRIGLLVFAVALATRAGWGIYRMAGAGANALEFPDEEQYWLMANSWLNGEGLRDELGFQATRMPLYPVLLAAAAAMPHGIVWARAAQWIVGACGAVLAMLLGRRLAGARVGLVAGLLFALDPFLIFFSSLLLTETLFITALLGLWAYVAPFIAEGREPGLRRWLLIAGLCVASVYARESTLGLIALGALLYLVSRRFDKRALTGILVVVLGLVAGLAPWAVRNHRAVGEWRWLTTRGGISLYDSVRPDATGASDLGDVKQSEAVRGLSEVEWNRYFLNESARLIHEQPGRIAALAARKFMRMWNPVPNVETYRSPLVRLVSAAWMIPLLVLAVAGVWLCPRLLPAHAWAVVTFLLLPAVYLSVLHMIFVGSVRYRLGAVPMLGVLAAMTLAHGVKFLGRREAVPGHD